jgi:hypothetical protein
VSTACCGTNLIARIDDINAIAAGLPTATPQPARGAMDIVRTPTGKGYYVVASTGDVFAFGDAKFFGSMGGHFLAAPVVDMAVRPQNDGYWLVGADGGVFAFGHAQMKGGMAGMHLNAPITGIECDAQGDGYWLLAQDGGVFTFGNTSFFGAATGKVPFP